MKIVKQNNKAVAIMGGGDQANRVNDDFYPKPIECTRALMDFLHDECSFHFYDKLTIWEPACGDGAMSEVIKTYGHKVISSDLQDRGYGVTGLDFINHSETYDCDAIITNPPFNLSQKFIELSMDKRFVCMLLKSQYWHAAKRVELFDKYTPTYICPLTWRPDFSGGGNPTMDCMWVVWIRGINTAKYMPLRKPKPINQLAIF